MGFLTIFVRHGLRDYHQESTVQNRYRKVLQSQVTGHLHVWARAEKTII
jgi:hypothetical protein